MLGHDCSYDSHNILFHPHYFPQFHHFHYFHYFHHVVINLKNVMTWQSVPAPLQDCCIVYSGHMMMTCHNLLCNLIVAECRKCQNKVEKEVENCDSNLLMDREIEY
jgi:hypothetical protein